MKKVPYFNDLINIIVNQNTQMANLENQIQKLNDMFTEKDQFLALLEGEEKDTKIEDVLTNEKMDKLKIIQVYLYTSPCDPIHINALHNKVINLSKDFKKMNGNVIVMEQNMMDTIDLLHEITTDDNIATFFPKGRDNASPNRIDYIWMDNNLILELKDSLQFILVHYNMDHKMKKDDYIPEVSDAASDINSKGKGKNPQTDPQNGYIYLSPYLHQKKDLLD
ncbi:hypothetical protein C1645_881156 [Glomus cerebriforme]|uniref:Uncharacterized protein n=1 Tax=Glomus cerebriforme TaxID=658196 RepID=A0A397S9R5_9GLOM|nr:hypothetical protein C1645_881156 [Glomus cerebriforme]